MASAPKEVRGLIILAAAILFRAARMASDVRTKTDTTDAMDDAESIVELAERRGHIQFEEA